MKKKVTIQDIADALGISRNTVSKAINNSEGLADETREKILQKAVEMGYKQFSYVQSLYRAAGTAKPEIIQPSKIGEIALLTTAFFGCSHFASAMLDRLQQEFNQLGYRINTHQVTLENIKNRTLPYTFLHQKTAAVLCIELFDWDYADMVCELGLPVLFVDGPANIGGRRLSADQLLMENFNEITRLMTELINRGARKIGFLGDFRHCQSFYERFVAFYGAMIQNGLSVDQRFVIPCLDILDLYEKMAALDELPDLFICANDSVAIDAMKVLKKLGKSVPEDVMLAGFDDSPEARTVVPALTSVHIHTQFMAYAAVQLLMSRIQEPSLNFRKVYTETNLVFRESTGSIPKDED